MKVVSLLCHHTALIVIYGITPSYGAGLHRHSECLSPAGYITEFRCGLAACFRGMPAAKDGRRQAHMDVLVAVPGKQAANPPTPKSEN